MPVQRSNTFIRIVTSMLAAGSLALAQESEDNGSKHPAFPATSNGWQLASTINHLPLKEASGFVVSRAQLGMLWTHNDGGAGSNLFGVDIATGTVLVTTTIPEIPNLDWEDALAVSHNGHYFIGIADLGDNEKRRRDCVIHLFKETAQREGKPPTVTLNRSIRFRYPDGKRYDSESAAFDPRSGNFLVLTKSKMETLLFEVALPAKPTTATAEAKPITALAKPTAYPDVGAMISLKRGIFGASATAADISPDGNLLAVLTYTECLLYRRGSDEDWKTAAIRPPEVLSLPGVYQAEALCFSIDGAQLLVTSENTPSPLYRIAVPAATTVEP